MIIDRDDVNALVLCEERARAVEWLLPVDHRTDPAGERHLGERHRDAAVGNVVHRGQLIQRDRFADQVADATFGGEVDRRRRAGVELLAAVAFA